MEISKYLLLIFAIFVNQSIARQNPDIYVQDVGFMVGIFEVKEIENKVDFISQGVLINSNQVFTSSANLLENVKYVVRAYNWPKNYPSISDQTISNTKYQEREVDDFTPINSSPLLKKLFLKRPFNVDFTTLDYVYPSGKETPITDYECTLIKLKYQPGFRNRVVVKQRKIVENKAKSGSCSDEISADTISIHRHQVDKYLCASEAGKRRCNSHPGSALVCKMKSSAGYFLRGIEVANKGCEIMFYEPIHRKPQVSSMWNKYVQDFSF